MKVFRLALLGAGIAAAVAFAGVGRPERASGDASPSAPAITVTGSGSVTATPTQAQFTFGVTTQATTAAQALAANAQRMQAVIGALESAGLPAGSLQTTSVSLSTRTSPDGNTIVGYDASNSVSATIAALDRAGTIVDTAVAAGANEVDGPNLTVADQASFYQAALKAAVADAHAKAEVLAAASGLTVGAVRSVAEQSATPTPVQFAPAALSSGTPIEQGTQQITAAVTVVFDAS